jgi:hypothetical protein|uniref:Uncharacterized protein n=1 Tax=Fagus sylvatica TaxID=28930 RepID=A0A2N9IUT3_FAGSY
MAHQASPVTILAPYTPPRLAVTLSAFLAPQVLLRWLSTLDLLLLAILRLVSDLRLGSLTLLPAPTLSDLLATIVVTLSDLSRNHSGP